MHRHLMKDLLTWKDSPNRKPLILNGARQVGKTWLLKEFGKTSFENVAYVNFDNNARLARQFDDGYDLDRLILAMQAEARTDIVPGKTLLIMDEIQECPKALTSLKYFCEEKRNLAIASAGSLIGLAIHSGTGFPVGKVNTLHLYPLSFREYLDAKGEVKLRELIDSAQWEILSSFSDKLRSLLTEYYYIGGMPEVVSSFIDNPSFETARIIQLEIIGDYENDMSRHLSNAESENCIAAWRSIPSQLAHENKRFVFGHVREGARARDFYSALTWLEKAGLVHKVTRVSKPGIPLSAYSDSKIFKLFCLDIGLLAALSDLDYRAIIEGNRIFTEFKGSMAEQFVCQELIASGLEPFYWSAENSRGEVDFLIQDKSGIYPIEVKAEENLRSKSLRAFYEKYPDTRCIRFSLSGYRDQGWMRNIPLWAVGRLDAWA